MDESIITINKDQNGKFIVYWPVQFLKDIYTSPTYKCDNFSFRITFANPNLYRDKKISAECNFWDFKYIEHDIQYNMLIINKSDPENDCYCSSGTQETYNRDFAQNFVFEENSNKEEVKLIFTRFIESSNQEKETILSNVSTFYFYIELQVVSKSKNIVTWFIPTEEIDEYHIIPEPISFQNCNSNCIFTQNEDGFYSFQFFFFDIKKAEILTCLTTVHNKDSKLDGTLNFCTLISPSSECMESKLQSTFITREELFDETKGWLFDGGLHITIILNSKSYKHMPNYFPKSLRQKKEQQERLLVVPSPEEEVPNPYQNQSEKHIRFEQASNCESVDYYSIKLNDNNKFYKEVNLFCKQKNILIPSNGKYTICLNLNESMFNKHETKGIYTSPPLITELNDNEFQIIINLNDKKLSIKSKNDLLQFLFNVKYSDNENCNIFSPNGQEVDLPFDLKTAFEPNDWLFSKKNDNCYIYDCYNVILPEDTNSNYLKIYVDIRYIENMIDGIDILSIESNSSISILTLNIPTDAIVIKNDQIENPKLYFPKITYKSPNSDYISVLKPEIFIHYNESGNNELLYFEVIINREESEHPIFMNINFMKHSIERTEDELIKQSKYQYAQNDIRRFSFPIQIRYSFLNDYQFIESDNESYFKMILVMIAGDYTPTQKVPPIDISKIEERKNNNRSSYRENIAPKKRNSMIKNKMYHPKYTEEDINMQIDVLKKEIENIDSTDNNNKTKRSADHPYAGLKNQGATCYMNSILQSLFHLPAFRKIVYEMPTKGNEDVEKSIPLNLQRLFFDLQFSDAPLSTEDLTKSFGWGSVETFNQHDSQEFLRVLLENLMEKMKKTDLPDEIPNLFKGKIRRYIKCLNVPYETSHEEEFYDVSVPIKNLAKLEDSFESYIKPQELNGNNQYKTEQHGLQDAITGEEFVMFPPILFLHLTRFEYNITTGRQEKINDRFEFPSTIDLTKYLAKDAPGLANNNTYDLYGVIVHSGTSQGGHYYAFLKTHPEDSNTGQWFQFNDSTVTKDTEERAIRDNFGGYIGGGSSNSENVSPSHDIVNEIKNDIKDKFLGPEIDIDYDHEREIRNFNRHTRDSSSDSDSDSDPDRFHRIIHGNEYRHRKSRHTTHHNRSFKDERIDRFMREMNNVGGGGDSYGGINQIEKDFRRQRYLAIEMMKRDKYNHNHNRDYDYHYRHPEHDYFHDREIINRRRERERESKPTPISHSAYILIYVRRDEATKVFQPIRDEDVPQHLRDYMKNKEKEKKLDKIKAIKNDFDSQIKYLTVFMMNENILSDLCKKKITGWDEQDNFERACRNSDSLNMQTLDLDLNMKCDEFYNKIAQIYKLDRNEIRIWRCNIVDNFPLKIIPDSDKCNIGGMRHHMTGGKMTIMIQIRTKENSLNKDNFIVNENKENTENKDTNSSENATTENKESISNENKETTENNDTNSSENATTDNKESISNENKETTENNDTNSNENATTENKDTNSNENKETTENNDTNSNENTENSNENETEKDSVLPLDINNNLMLYIKFFFPSQKKSPLKFIGSLLLDLNEDHYKNNEEEGRSDRLDSILTPTVNRMIGFPEDTKLEAFTERTQDVVKFDLDRSITSIKNDYSFRNGSILIFQLPKDSPALTVPSKFTLEDEKEESTTTESPTLETTENHDPSDTQKVPLFHWEGSKFAESKESSSITDYIAQTTNCLRLEIRNINDFKNPVARLVTNGRITFKELHEFVHDKILHTKSLNKQDQQSQQQHEDQQNQQQHEDQQSQQKHEDQQSQQKHEDENKDDNSTNESIDKFYSSNKKDNDNVDNNNNTSGGDDENTGKFVQKGEEGPLLFFIIKILEQDASKTNKDPLKISSINTIKYQVVNDVFNRKENSMKRKNYKIMKTDLNEAENGLKNESFFILCFYEFKAFYGSNKEMAKYKTQYSENACDYSYEVNFKAPLKMCMIDTIYLNFFINKAINLIGETIYPLKYNSSSIPEKIEPEKHRVVLMNNNVVIEFYTNMLTYAKTNYMFMVMRIEKIPSDQIGIENENFMKFYFAYSCVLSSSGNKPMVITKKYGAPFLLNVIKDEKFSDSKKRILNFIGFGNLANEPSDEFTFRLDTSYADLDCQPLINDDDYLTELMKKSKSIAVIPKNPPESNIIFNSNTEKTEDNDKKSKDEQNHSRKSEQTRKNPNSIKIYN